MGQDFSLEVILNLFGEGYVLMVAQIGVGLGIALGVVADYSLFISFPTGHPDRFELGGGQLDAPGLERGFEFREKILAGNYSPLR
ncbi:hypothetical protein [Thiolapillus sp.]|uniref:hypothetical protein n=1 Tax=Thiolapillus sp. TaxID=2017437 RepID=UPI003AF67469